jgi:predicted metal-dependent hydrolase
LGLLFRQRLADGEVIEVAGVPVRLKVSGRARRISLRLELSSGEIVAIAPTVRQLATAAAFAQQRADWIRSQIAARPRPQGIEPGQSIEVLGRPCVLAHRPGRASFRPAAHGEPALIGVGGDPSRFSNGVIRVLKAEGLGMDLGKPLPRISIADARSRWGSCRPPRTRGFGAECEVGRIRYSWRLILAPYAVADYVAAHEVAHLVEANHSPQFWAVVKGLVGDHRPHRAWLREHGARLHAFGGGG